MANIESSKKVAYLIGAGGSHACVKALHGSTGILMSDLATDLATDIKCLVDRVAQYRPLRSVVNEIITEETDFEHLITFFDESPSALHKKFADKLREVFEDVLNKRLKNVKEEIGSHPTSLYEALFDMYNVKGINESLHGILTLNYDDYIEVAAAEIHDHDSPRIDLDFGESTNKTQRCWFLKLHGSFGWEDTWPIRRREVDSTRRPLWIPPGIRKGKERYPFNLLWGLARDILNCDVLRVIGCRLGPSDWDLISLLFSTRHANRDCDNRARDRPYVIEIIDSPNHATRLQKSYPYLDVKSLFEIDTLDIGRSLVGEFMGIAPCKYDTLSNEQTMQLRKTVEDRNDENWFRKWLVQMGEGLQATLGEESTTTDKGAFRRWLEI